MNNLPIVQLKKQYTFLELLKAFLTGIIFVIMYTGIGLPPIIMISMLYIPYIQYFLLIIYIVVSLAFSRGLSIMMKTLQEYRQVPNLPYKTIAVRLNIVLAIIVFVILSYIYIMYLQ